MGIMLLLSSNALSQKIGFRVSSALAFQMPKQQVDNWFQYGGTLSGVLTLRRMEFSLGASYQRFAGIDPSINSGRRLSYLGGLRFALDSLKRWNVDFCAGRNGYLFKLRDFTLGAAEFKNQTMEWAFGVLGAGIAYRLNDQWEIGIHYMSEWLDEFYSSSMQARYFTVGVGLRPKLKDK